MLFSSSFAELSTTSSLIYKVRRNAKDFCKSLDFSFAQISWNRVGPTFTQPPLTDYPVFPKLGRDTFFLSAVQVIKINPRLKMSLFLFSFFVLDVPEKRSREKETNDTEIIWIIWPEGKKVQRSPPPEETA